MQTLGIDMDEGDGLTLDDKVFKSPFQGILAALVFVNGHSHQQMLATFFFQLLTHDDR